VKYPRPIRPKTDASLVFNYLDAIVVYEKIVKAINSLFIIYVYVPF